jgi:7,8-dihydro-6-hydroxymethylpterin dimethyltransferase
VRDLAAMTAHSSPQAATLNAAEVLALVPTQLPRTDALGDLRQRMQRSGQWREGQMAGRRWPIACVSLEVTQRCNLDCTLCYLSESSEAVRDLPLEEVFRRIDLIVAHYGRGTDVQVSGGEPTLRRRDELIAIVERLAQRGLRASLFTNGIKASRELLTTLAHAGLTDVAFHVDMTQQRAGFASEAALNTLRSEYIERARGLGLGVFFNTTVHVANAHEVPMLAAFFKAQAEVVRFVSFQLQAETGRGVLGARADAITNDSVSAQLCEGVGTPLHFNTLLAGHHDCNRSAVLLVINGRAYDAFADEAFIQRFMRDTALLQIDRGTQWRALRSLVKAALSRPALVLASLRWLLNFAWKARRDLIAARGRVHKLTLFTHNFMDACQLDRERIDACVFMAVTQHGPMSMCTYNAKRDHYLLQPLATSQGEWQPLARQEQPIKFLKGRAREAWLQARRETSASAS